MKTGLFIVCLAACELLIGAPHASAEEYPEIPSTVAYGPGYVSVWGEVYGSYLRTDSVDPGCDEIHAICRRICGDLPPGKEVGRVSGVGISPPDYARSVGDPEVYRNKVVRVCMRVKNWGTNTRKTFAFTVRYAEVPDPLLEFIGRLVEEDSAAAKSSGSKLTPRVGEVSASRTLDPGSSGVITANSQLPSRGKSAFTRYQVSIAGSGWLDCDVNNGSCAIADLQWEKLQAGEGTLRNNSASQASGRVIIEFVEAPPAIPKR